VLQFLLQLNIWPYDDPLSLVSKLKNLNNMHNIGFIYIADNQYNFKVVLKTFYTEILVLAFVLIHI